MASKSLNHSLNLVILLKVLFVPQQDTQYFVHCARYRKGKKGKQVDKKASGETDEFFRHGLLGLDYCLDTKPWTWIKYSSRGLNLLFYCFFLPSFTGTVSPPCPTYSTLDSAVCVSGATLKREPGSFGDRGNMQSVRDNTEEQWKPNPKRTPHTEPTSCKQDSASRKDVRPNSHNVLQPQDYFYLYLFFSNSPRYALSATVVMLPFWSCCICSYKSQETILFLMSLAMTPWVVLLNNCCHVCVIEFNNLWE